MDVKKISEDIKTQEWITRIKECRDSGLSVRKWCELNNICPATYYIWLRKLRTVAIETGIVKAPSFVPVPIDSQTTSSPSNLVISKGDVHIDIPTNTDINLVTNLIKVLLC